jgi:hypothetical protein
MRDPAPVTITTSLLKLKALGGAIVAVLVRIFVEQSGFCSESSDREYSKR